MEQTCFLRRLLYKQGRRRDKWLDGFGGGGVNVNDNDNGKGYGGGGTNSYKHGGTRVCALCRNAD